MSQKPLSARIRYAVDNFMARGGLSVFLALLTLFLIAFVLMAILRVLINALMPDATLPEVPGALDYVWRVFMEIMDPGAIAEDGDANYGNKLIGIVTIFLGLVLFSSMVAFITSQFEAKIQDLRKGKSEVIESGHTLILGFSERVTEIVHELIVAFESERDAVIGVLAEQDKEVMDDFFNEHVSDRRSTRIVTRSGVPSSPAALERMGITRVKSVVVLNPAGSADAPEAKSLADARVLKTIMAVLAATQRAGVPPIVAELHLERNRQLARDVDPAILAIDRDGILARMLVQTSRISGLAIVYSNLVGFEGNEIYFYRATGGWRSKNFGELQFHFLRSQPLGVRQADGTVLLNPPSGFQPADADELIILAEDDSAIRFYADPPVRPRLLPLAGARVEPGPERQLLVGWNNKSEVIVDEYAKILPAGSSIDVVVVMADDTMRRALARIKERRPGTRVRLLQADIHQSVGRLVPEEYDNVILLAGEGGSAEESDAATIAALLRFRQYFRSLEKNGAGAVRTQLITEVMDSTNTDLVLNTGAKDFLISNQFVSKILAQVSQEPGVQSVYDDLFDPEGSEVYLKPARLYFRDLPARLRFADCVLAAQRRNEVCFGIRRVAEEKDAARNYGVDLIPAKNAELELTAEDLLIVLAENET